MKFYHNKLFIYFLILVFLIYGINTKIALAGGGSSISFETFVTTVVAVAIIVMAPEIIPYFSTTIVSEGTAGAVYTEVTSGALAGSFAWQAPVVSALTLQVGAGAIGAGIVACQTGAICPPNSNTNSFNSNNSNITGITSPTCTPSTGSWSSCSGNCSTAGTQTRTITNSDCSTTSESQNCAVSCPSGQTCVSGICYAPPTVSLSATYPNNQEIEATDSIGADPVANLGALSWSSTNATTCTASGS
ncbi:hypothetical protein HZB04_04060, partial [Candidatus Wolfebacteria bacterium]|nr:hypothetical protein [Candidatus Wolfebacteria bacterium]